MVVGTLLLRSMREQGLMVVEQGASSLWNAMLIERTTTVLANILSTLVYLAVMC
jgi:hypothetical protein